jgi:hypothetical protein
MRHSSASIAPKSFSMARSDGGPSVEVDRCGQLLKNKLTPLGECPVLGKCLLLTWYLAK